LFRVTAAEGGELVYADEPRGETEVPYGEDMDFADYRHLHAKGMVVVARFVGRGMTAADLAAILAEDRGYVLPGRRAPAYGRLGSTPGTKPMWGFLGDVQTGLWGVDNSGS
jgi:hypothetical protein